MKPFLPKTLFSIPSVQEFNIEKLQIVEAEKRKIRQEYERKEKQLEIKKKMYDEFVSKQSCYLVLFPLIMIAMTSAQQKLLDAIEFITLKSSSSSR